MPGIAGMESVFCARTVPGASDAATSIVARIQRVNVICRA
jgi:hypothetical protein